MKTGYPRAAKVASNGVEGGILDHEGRGVGEALRRVETLAEPPSAPSKKLQRRKRLYEAEDGKGGHLWTTILHQRVRERLKKKKR